MSYCTENLTEAQREAIAADCFQVTEKRGDELHGLCPFHGENKPSFSYNFVKDLCNCFSCGAAGDLIALFGVSRGYGSNEEAFKAFREQYGPSPGQPAAAKSRARARATGGQGAQSEEVTRIIPEKDWDKMPGLPESIVARCREDFGWSDEVIKRFSLRVWSNSQEQRIAIPIRRDDGSLVNVRLYKPGASDNKIISWGKGFGKSKLFPAPSSWKNGPVVICEGEKDTLCALSQGINACTQTAGCNSWDDKFTRFFDGRDVIIAYDADEKGQVGAEKVAKKLIKVASSVRILVWPEFMGMVPDHGEDLTDFFVKHKRSAQHLKDLIAVTPMMEKPEASQRAESLPEDVKRFFGGARGTQFKPRLVADEILNWRKIVHDPKSGMIYSWNDRHWEEYDPANIRRQVLTLLDVEGTTPRVNDCLGIVKDLAVMPHGRQLNDRENMIPLQNGMFCLHRGAVDPHAPDNFNSYAIEINLNLNGRLPTCNTWMQFLKESVADPDTIVELQKFFGLCCTRETRYEKALLLIGPGGDGKGTILKVLQSLLGQVNVSNVGMSGLQDQFHRVMLVDKLLNVATEVEAGLLQSDIFKTIVSGESVTAAYKHKNAFSFTPVCKLAFSSNKHPNMQDTSDGLYRRLLLIEMEKQFVKQGRADLYLYDKLMQERDGIFMWALRGLQLLRQDGFRPSEFMADCLDRFQEINNPVLSFVRHHVDSENPESWTDTMTVYDKYTMFCRKRGYKQLGESRFGIELRKVCTVKKERESRGRRRWGYKGLSLVDDYDA